MNNKIVAYLPNGKYVFDAILPISPRVGEYIECEGMLFEIKRVTYRTNAGHGVSVNIKIIVEQRSMALSVF